MKHNNKDIAMLGIKIRHKLQYFGHTHTHPHLHTQTHTHTPTHLFRKKLYIKCTLKKRNYIKF